MHLIRNCNLGAFKMLSWRKLNEVLSDLDEEEVVKLLENEKIGARRAMVMIRLHQRFCTLRMARERNQLFGEGQ
jgi:hypothetical protein